MRLDFNREENLPQRLQAQVRLSEVEVVEHHQKRAGSS